MPKGKKVVEQGLLSKGFERTEADHHRFIYWSLEGKKSTAATKTSHSGKDIVDSILSQMAKQCGLTMKLFRDLVDVRSPARITKQSCGKAVGYRGEFSAICTPFSSESVGRSASAARPLREDCS